MQQVELSKAWRTALTALRSTTQGAAFDLWIDEVQPFALVEDTVRCAVPNGFVLDLMSERYSGALAQALSQALAQVVRVRFEVADPAIVNAASNGHESAPAARGAEPIAGVADFATLPLNPRFTFDTFVVGPSNRFPHAAAQAVAKAPARSYNPLFLYGGVGLGKTHLMQAIGHLIRERQPDANIVYVSGETFLYHYVTGIREDRMDDFRRRYRSVDVWLVDDIQFIASRAGTEAEFFHTFNALHQTNKQIVVTSDRPPKELLIEDRLRSRFEWGLITDIKPPDIETRLAILQKRVSAERLEVDDEVLMYIAHAVRESIRRLEGALLRVVASASLLGEEVTVDLARECLQDYSVADRPSDLTAGGVLEAVAGHYGFDPSALRDKSRRQDVVLARQVAMYLCRELLALPFAEIGRQFGRDHTTVMHACTKIGEQVAAGDAPLGAALETLRARLADQDG
jgi:chromosomal replication initiator protein